MRVCTGCNRILTDGELECPRCTAKKSADSGKLYGESASVPPKVISTGTAENNIAIGTLDAESKRYSKSETEREIVGSGGVSMLEKMGYNSAQSERKEVVVEKPATPSISATQAFTIEIPLGEVLEKLDKEKKKNYKQKISEQSGESEKDGEKVGDTVDFPFEKINSSKKDKAQNIENAGIIEQELAAREQSKTRNSKSINKLVVSMFAVLIIAVLAFSTQIIAKLISKPEAADESYYLTRLTGTWSGEPFKFADDPDDKNTYMEILKINSDATFTLQYLIVNESIPNGYLDGEWEVSEELSGTVRILSDNATLALVYEQNGSKMVFLRDIIELEDNRIVLREYSENEDYFYDMAFKREK